jgi:hypothetical protein
MSSALAKGTTQRKAAKQSSPHKVTLHLYAEEAGTTGKAETT